RHGRLGLRGSYPCKPFARPPADFCDDIRGDGCPHPSGGAKLRSPAMFRILPSFGSAAQTWASGPTWFVPVQTVCSSSCRFLRRHTWGRVPSPVRRSEAPLPCHVPDIAELWLGRPDVGVWAYVVRTRANRLLVLLQILPRHTWGRVPSPVRRSEVPLPCHVPDIAELWLGRPDMGVWAYVVRTRANRLLVLLQILPRHTWGRVPSPV